jgi:SAM-dependent methyltransferase
VPFDGRVLLLGDGNLSFTEANLNLGRNSADNVTATIYSPDGRFSAETQARAQELRNRGVDVQEQVDARNIPPDLAGGQNFDSITFVYPHPGGPRSDVARNGRDLLERYFRSAGERLKPGGRLSVTLRGGHFYLGSWQPVKSARRVGLRLESVVWFTPDDYPGYGHVTTSANASKPDVSQGITLIFVRDQALD